MNAKLVLCLLLLFSFRLNAQDSLKVYSWEEALAAPSPDSVKAIDASRLKWETLPDELLKFTQLVYLDVSRNKLATLPDLGSFTSLRHLDLSRNKFTTFPVSLCKMTALTRLSLGRNLIETIPECIGYFFSLVYLDLWDNPIKKLPEQLTKLTALRTVDLRGILFNKQFQEGWRTKMPNVTWHFDYPCECIE